MATDLTPARPRDQLPKDDWELIRIQDRPTMVALHEKALDLARRHLTKRRFTADQLERYADDLAQDAVVTVIEHLAENEQPAYKEPGQLLQGRIANLTHELERALGRDTYVALDAGDGIDPAAEEATEFRQLMGPSTRWQAIATALEVEVGARCRELLRLRYFEELKYREIGERMQLSAGYLRSQHGTCMDKLVEASIEWFERYRDTSSALRWDHIWNIVHQKSSNL